MRGPLASVPSLPLRGSACPVLVALSALEVLVTPAFGAPVVVVPSSYARPCLLVSVGNFDFGVDRASLSALVVALMTARVTVPTSSSWRAARASSTSSPTVVSSDPRVLQQVSDCQPPQHLPHHGGMVKKVITVAAAPRLTVNGIVDFIHSCLVITFAKPSNLNSLAVSMSLESVV